MLLYLPRDEELLVLELGESEVEGGEGASADGDDLRRERKEGGQRWRVL